MRPLPLALIHMKGWVLLLKKDAKTPWEFWLSQTRYASQLVGDVFAHLVSLHPGISKFWPIFPLWMILVGSGHITVR